MSKTSGSFMDNIKHWAKELWLFITSMFFLRSFGRMMLFILGVFLFIHFGLRCYTRHGKSVTVDNYVGMTLENAVEKLEDKSFRHAITDSVFIVDEKPGIVLAQNPDATEEVKKGRTIYLTITKQTPDEVALPELIGNYDFKQYTRKLRLLNIKATIKEQQFNNKLEENTILHFYYGEQKITDDELRKGVKVPMGSTLDFVVSTRTGGFVEVPELLCEQFKDAEFLILGSGLKVGEIDAGNTTADNPDAFIIRQEPEYAPGKKIKIGASVKLFFAEDKPAFCE